MKHASKGQINPLLVSLVALLFSLTAWAQQSTSQQNNDNNSNASTIQGCVTGAAGTYVLLDRNTGASYNLTGDEADLARQIHHEVEITGQPVNGAQNSSSTTDNSTADQSAASGKQIPRPATFKVTSVREVSDHCQSPQQPQ